jgi:hypothetical protein
LKVNFLEQVAALFRVGLVGAREPLQGRAVLAGRIFITVILARPRG